MEKILIVDDAEFMRLTLAAMLEKEGYDIVDQVVNGQDTIQYFKEKEPDLVMMNTTMPIMNGLDVLKAIKKIDENIVCSATGQQKIVVETIELGAKDFIVKPFDEIRVLETIHNILSEHKTKPSEAK